ncbi:hypothetical protein A4A49_40195 [Nicotiana attenuata]|uniref:Uncharacterized protein n=1 Tax=Nicotiana attenuata TaxID=49451 RepID=A0A1J6KAE2_NICAT|nr:hypothetical protein A4A49_40195 [Nicotiana attenuata]
MWAPAHSQSRTQDGAEGNQKTLRDFVGPLNSDNVAQSNSNRKRTEIERYKGKHVSKELAEQGSTQQPILTSSSHNGTDRATLRAEPSCGNSGGTLSTIFATDSLGFPKSLQSV